MEESVYKGHLGKEEEEKLLLDGNCSDNSQNHRMFDYFLKSTQIQPQAFGHGWVQGINFTFEQRVKS